MRQALGTAVFFGMIGVTVFGLLFTPVFYVIASWVTSKLPDVHVSRRHPPPPDADDARADGGRMMGTAVSPSARHPGLAARLVEGRVARS